jgi:hypothetical protein
MLTQFPPDSHSQNLPTQFPPDSFPDNRFPLPSQNENENENLKLFLLILHHHRHQKRQVTWSRKQQLEFKTKLNYEHTILPKLFDCRHCCGQTGTSLNLISVDLHRSISLLMSLQGFVLTRNIYFHYRFDFVRRI